MLVDAQVADERAAAQRARHEAAQRRFWQQQRRLEDAEWHAERLAALVERQEQLAPVVIQQVTAQTGTPPWRLPADVGHAMGVSIFVGHHVVAVVCPVASRITGEVADRLAGVTVYVASEYERRAVARPCRPGQRMVVLTDGAVS